MSSTSAIAAPPRSGRRQISVFAEQLRADRRQERRAAPAIRARRCRTRSRRARCPCATPARSPGTPSADRRAAPADRRSRRRARRRMACTRRRPVDGLQVDAIVADGQVGAFDQREAEVARRDRRARSRSRCSGPGVSSTMCGVCAVGAGACRAASPAACGRTARAAARAARGTRRETAARSSAGSRARSRRPTAPACGSPARASAPSGPRAEIEARPGAETMPPGGVDAVAARRKPGWPNTTAGGISPVAPAAAAGRRGRRRSLRAAARAAAARLRCGSHSAGRHDVRQHVERPRPRCAAGRRGRCR